MQAQRPRILLRREKGRAGPLSLQAADFAPRDLLGLPPKPAALLLPQDGPGQQCQLRYKGSSFRTVPASPRSPERPRTHAPVPLARRNIIAHPFRSCYETLCRRSAARILSHSDRGLTAPANFIPPLRGWIDRFSIGLFHHAGLEWSFVTASSAVGNRNQESRVPRGRLTLTDNRQLATDNCFSTAPHCPTPAPVSHSSPTLSSYANRAANSIS